MIIASEMIVAGDMIVEQTTHPTADVFGYLRSFHPIEIVEKEKVIIDMYNTPQNSDHKLK